MNCMMTWLLDGMLTCIHEGVMEMFIRWPDNTCHNDITVQHTCLKGFSPKVWAHKRKCDFCQLISIRACIVGHWAKLQNWNPLQFFHGHFLINFKGYPPLLSKNFHVAFSQNFFIEKRTSYFVNVLSTFAEEWTCSVPAITSQFLFLTLCKSPMLIGFPLSSTCFYSIPASWFLIRHLHLDSLNDRE